MPHKLLVMGVAGCGKSSVAAGLARALDGLHIEGDDGESLELVASVEQLDLLGEAIDQLLEQEDADADDE